VSEPVRRELSGRTDVQFSSDLVEMFDADGRVVTFQ
jgi:hypothetical protein